MNATSIREDLAGRVVSGRFPLLQWLGSSRGAGVFLTEYGDPSQKSTIKLVPADSDEAEIRMTAWLAAVNLSHPNLMKVFASGRCEVDSAATLYVVSEYADEVLAEIVPERALTAQEAREMIGPAVDALAYLHAKGFVHGRLKPSNIMAVGDQLKLSTDGLILSGAIGKHSIERTIYDAPETIQGRIGPAADVWALGVTLIEILTQRPPAWYGAASAEPEVPESIPEPFATIARECLRKDPARRCSLEQIRSRLQPGAVLPPAKKKAVLEFKVRPGAPEAPAGPANLAKFAEFLRPAKLAVVAELADPRRRLAASAGVVALVILAFVLWTPRWHHKLPSQPAAEPQIASPAPPAPSPTPSRSSRPSRAAITTPKQPPASSAPAAAAAPRPAVPATQSQPSGSGASKGEVAQQVEPDVLASAMRTISGTLKVAVRVSVDATGKVTDAGFESAGPSRYFGGKAIDAARRWSFRPAEVNGQAVASVWILHFEFRQSGVTFSANETAP